MNPEYRVHELSQRINELCQLGQWDLAAAACQELVQLSPHDGFAWYCYGLVVTEMGQPFAGISAFQKAVSLATENSQFLSALCDALHKHGRWQEAAQACQQILSTNAGDIETLHKLAICHARQGQLPESASAYERIISLAPDRVDFALEFAEVLCNMGHSQRSLAIVGPLLARNATLAPAWLVQGMSHLMRANWDEAADAFQRVLLLEPRTQQATLGLSIALSRQWQLPEAESVLRGLLATDPKHVEALSTLGGLLRMQGKTAEAIAAWSEATSASKSSQHHSQLLLTLQYDQSQTSESLLTAHRQWADFHVGQPIFALRPPVSYTPNAPLRLGLVSGDFGIQATGFLLLPLLEALDKRQVTTVCYSDRDQADAITNRFRAAASQWHDTRGWPQFKLVQQIRTDEIDLLIDLMGHTSGHMALFANMPAPLSATWLGYVGTTGLSAIDFLLADRYHVRPGEEASYVETVLRLPNGYACYSPLVATPEPATPPAMRRGFVTFGCFNNPAKYSPGLLDMWTELLERVPHSRLHLKYGGLDHPEMQARIRLPFVKRGLAASRLSFEGWTSIEDLFQSYHQVDVALDTQPYSGGVTTCEALWMGVPVITFSGATFASRHATSHVSNAGFPQFVASDAGGYINLAASYANRLDELATLRSQIRERMRQSPLCDAPRFAADFLSVIDEARRSRKL